MSLEGRLEDLSLGDIFQIISLSKRSGVLTLIRKEGTARMVFTQGQVIFASSDTRSRLGYTLVRKGIISNEDLEQSLRMQKTKGSIKPIGTLLLEMGAIDQQTLEREIRDHVIQIIQDLLTWDTGSFHFELGPVPDEEVVLRVGLNTEFLLLEGARRGDEAKRSGGEKTVQAQLPPREPPIKTEKVQKAPNPPIREERPATPPPTPAAGPAPSESRGLEELAVPEASPKISQGSPGKVRKDLALLTSMIGELSGPSTSSEITLLILRFASEIMNRAVILLIRKEDIAGLGQAGLSVSEGEAQERVRSIRMPLSESTVFKDVVEKRITYKGAMPKSHWHDYFINKLGEDWPGEVFIAPMVCEGRVIAVLYGDDGSTGSGIPFTEGLEAFIKVAGFAFGKALLERKLQDTKTPRRT